MFQPVAQKLHRANTTIARIRYNRYSNIHFTLSVDAPQSAARESGYLDCTNTLQSISDPTFVLASLGTCHKARESRYHDCTYALQSVSYEPAQVASTIVSHKGSKQPHYDCTYTLQSSLPCTQTVRIVTNSLTIHPLLFPPP